MVRGVHFALTAEQETQLRQRNSGQDCWDYIASDVEKPWDEDYLAETDKAWDAIHRCLTGQPASESELDANAGAYPLNRCIMGEVDLCPDTNNYIIRLNSPETVKDLAAALEPIDDAWITKAYHRHCPGAWPEYGDEDCEYTCEWFAHLKAFYIRAAKAGRAVVFSVSQ